MSELTQTPKTLADILAYLDAADSGLIDATPEQMAEMGALLVAKVDNTAEVIDELKYQAKRLRIASAKLAKGKRQVLARIDRLKEYMAYHMKAASFTQIPGEAWKVRLTSSKSVKPLIEKPDLPCAITFPQFVRVKYEWDKEALAAAIESGDEVAKTLAEIVPSNSVTFDVNKGKLLK